jgi:hypothetical protein
MDIYMEVGSDKNGIECFVERPFRRKDVTGEELRERIREAQQAIHAESCAMEYCILRLAELDGTDDDGQLEDDLDETPWA